VVAAGAADVVVVVVADVVAAGAGVTNRRLEIGLEPLA